MSQCFCVKYYFFFNDTATTEIYTLSLHDALPIYAHKWLNVPYDSGMVVVRDPRHLYAAMAVNAPYLVIGEAREPEHYTPEFSRRARGVEGWAPPRPPGRPGPAGPIGRTLPPWLPLAPRVREAG